MQLRDWKPARCKLLPCRLCMVIPMWGPPKGTGPVTLSKGGAGGELGGLPHVWSGHSQGPPLLCLICSAAVVCRPQKLYPDVVDAEVKHQPLSTKKQQSVHLGTLLGMPMLAYARQVLEQHCLTHRPGRGASGPGVATLCAATDLDVCCPCSGGGACRWWRPQKERQHLRQRLSQPAHRGPPLLWAGWLQGAGDKKLNCSWDTGSHGQGSTAQIGRIPCQDAATRPQKGATSKSVTAFTNCRQTREAQPHHSSRKCYWTALTCSGCWCIGGWLSRRQGSTGGLRAPRGGGWQRRRGSLPLKVHLHKSAEGMSGRSPACAADVQGMSAHPADVAAWHGRQHCLADDRSGALAKQRQPCPSQGVSC